MAGQAPRTAGRSLGPPVGQGGSSIAPAGSDAQLRAARTESERGNLHRQLIVDPTRGREHIEPASSESAALQSTRLPSLQRGLVGACIYAIC